MCYCNCKYERFNPITGDCRCVRGSNPCPEDMEYCEKCDDEVSSIQVEESLNAYDKILCEDCINNMLDNGELMRTCHHCGEKFTDEGYGKCPACRRSYESC